MSKSKQKFVLNPVTLFMQLGGLFSAFVLLIYAYLGTFSRHMADDYCSVGFTRRNFFTALWDNYQTVSDRFSNFMLIASSESLSSNSVATLPALMLILWVAGIAWLLYEASRFGGQNWSVSFVLSLACLLAFFALLQAPNRYQILYWRSSMATHFAPLVLMPSFAAFLLHQIAKKYFSAWMVPLVFVLAFLLGGFSEPTAVVLIALLACALAAAWAWIKPEARKSSLSLLAVAFAGALTALVVMALAPANSLRLGTPPPALPLLISRSFEYGYEFSVGAFRTLPLPTFFSLFIPFLIFYNLHIAPASALTTAQQKRMWLVLAAVPVLSYLLIVGSFAPSVYGQSFPVERARFAGQLILVAELMISGAVLGVLAAQWRPHFMQSLPLATITAVLLAISAAYPLRAAVLTFADIPEFRDRAVLWDARENYVYERIALGETELIVPSFPGIYGIKEWDEVETHWVNRCAAAYYQVDTIRAVTVPDEYLQDFFSGK